MAQTSLNSTGVASSGSLVLQSNGTTTAATFDTAQNMGLGVTPSAWGGGQVGLQVKNASLSGFSNSAYVMANTYYDGTNEKYIASSFACKYAQASGAHIWYTAASGTAGNAISFTQAMTLDASGRLGVGITSPGSGQGMVQVGGAGQSWFKFYDSSAGWNFGTFYKANGTTALAYLGGGGGSAISGGTVDDFVVRAEGNLLLAIGSTERARIDSSGKLTINRTDGTGIQAIGVYNTTTASAANMVVISDGVFQRSTSALKYKQDIRDVEDFDISALRPVRYKSKCEDDDQTKDHLGLIADEAADAGFEELVSRGAEGEVEGFQYERLTVVLLKKLQTLDAEFKAYVAAHP